MKKYCENCFHWEIDLLVKAVKVPENFGKCKKRNTITSEKTTCWEWKKHDK